MEYHNFEFETVTLVNEKIKKEIKSAKYFIEQIDKNTLLKMIYIPGGTFMMGSREEDNLKYGFPRHQVNVPSFHIGQFPITEKQWESIMMYNPHTYPSCQGENSERKNHPVTSVCWLEAIEFCQKLSQITGKKYRLPSEAEWEYACRAGTNTLYSFGDEITPEVANYWDYDEDLDTKELNTKEVGSFYPNGFGIYDLHGNIFELCQDIWHLNYDNAPSDGSAWENGENNNLVVIRGGSFDYYEDDCRSDFRCETLKHYCYVATGFRVVCS